MKRFFLSLLTVIPILGLWAKLPAETILSFHQTGETVRCSFQEIKSMPRLKKTIVKKGTLAYAHPDNLRMDYTDPKGDYTRIEKGLFEVSRSGKVQRFNVNDPQKRMSLFRQSLLLAFAGDVESIADLNNATIAYSETQTTYVCTLTVSAAEKGMRGVESMKLIYSRTNGALQSLTIVESNGNSTLYEIQK